MKIFNFIVFCHTFCKVLSLLPKINIINGIVNESLEVSVNSSNLSFVYFDYSYDLILKVQVGVTLHYKESFLVIIKDENKIVSSIDITRKNNAKILAERTVCPFLNTEGNKNRSLSLEISTNSTNITWVTILVKIINNFELELNKSRNFTISEYTPSFFLFKLKNNYIYNFLVQSSDNTCMIFSIQKAKCPMHIYDNDIIELNSIGYQTVTKVGSINAISSSQLAQAFVVFVIETNSACGMLEMINSTKSNIISKSFTLTVLQHEQTYYLPIFGAIGFFLLFYLVSPVISFIYMHCFYKSSTFQVSVDEELLNSSILESPLSYGSIIDHADITTLTSSNFRSPTINNSDFTRNHVLENSYDSVSDVSTDPNIFRLNKNVSLSDFSRKNPEVLNRKYFLYFWYLIVISVFYGLPVVQLVIKYQETFDKTGNQDLCYYNFRCAKPYFIFNAFNNVISNIGYVLLGILFTLLTLRRERYYKEGPKDYGIPQYYGLFYAMGISLTMEGIMSACYHICPSSNNFQFDTAYMYILACLCMIKIYQTRHPDINATAHSFFMTMALFIFVSVVGVVTVSGRIYFWIFFIILYFCVCAFLTCEVYYMGCWKLDQHIVKRIYHMILIDKWQIFIPTYKRRMVVLSFFNVVNLSISLYGVIEKPKNFPTYFLAVFMVNLLLYFGFYIIKKIQNSERFHKISILYVIISIICWSAALYCFIDHPTDWQKSPSLSREENQNCLLLDFYDIHDTWHFLSSMSMFFSFMALQNMDDCLIHTERNKIAIF